MVRPVLKNYLHPALHAPGTQPTATSCTDTEVSGLQLESSAALQREVGSCSKMGPELVLEPGLSTPPPPVHFPLYKCAFVVLKHEHTQRVRGCRLSHLYRLFLTPGWGRDRRQYLPSACSTQLSRSLSLSRAACAAPRCWK